MTSLAAAWSKTFKEEKKSKKSLKSGNFVIEIEYVNREQKGAQFTPSKITSLAAAWSKTYKQKKQNKSRNVVTKLENIQKSKTQSKLSELHRMCP